MNHTALALINEIHPAVSTAKQAAASVFSAHQKSSVIIIIMPPLP